MFLNFRTHVDWVLFFAVLPIVGAGLITMNSFSGENYFFEKQLIWASVSIIVFFVLSFIDWSFLKRSKFLTVLFFISVTLLASLFVVGSVFKGAKSWLNFGLFAIQPADFIKLVMIFLLAKYFSKRHIEIANFKHIFVSGTYALIFFIWFGMVMVSGISKKHLLLVFFLGAMAFGGLWGFVFQDYQKDRIRTFLNPLADIQGAGYNAYQSTIAVGSGQLLGKGVGFGTQSRLQFLPEYETDFIFASFAEE